MLQCLESEGFQNEKWAMIAHLQEEKTAEEECRAYIWGEEEVNFVRYRSLHSRAV